MISLLEAGQRLAQAIASSRDFTSIIQSPPRTSFDSVNGPSVTTGLPPSNETRAPIEGGCNPSSVISTPAAFNASLYFIIAATASAGGIVPGAAASSTLGTTCIMNRIKALRPLFRRQALDEPPLLQKTVGVLRYRHVRRNYFAGS